MAVSKKLTPWFDASVKPVHVGAYRVTHNTWSALEAWACWNGTQWSDSSILDVCPGDFNFSASPGIYQDKIWRGLERKP